MKLGVQTSIEYIWESLRAKGIVQEQEADDEVVGVKDITSASKKVKRMKPRGKRPVRLGERIRWGTKR